MALRLLRPMTGPLPKSPALPRKRPEKDSAPVRDPAYLKSFADRYCVICGRKGCVPCHLNAGLGGGKGIKAGDDTCLDACSFCHQEMDTWPDGIGNYLLRFWIIPMRKREYRAWKAERNGA